MIKRKNMRVFKALLVIVVLSVLVGMTAWFALWQGDYRDVDSQNVDTTDIFDVLQFGNGSIELTEKDLNGLAAEFLAKPLVKGNIIIDGAEFKLNDDKITLEARMKYRGISLVPGISGKLDLKADKLVFNVSSIKLGKLLLPRRLIMEFLMGYSSRDLKIYNNRVEVNREIIPLDIKSLRSENSKIVFEMMSISEIFKAESPGESLENSYEKVEISNADESQGNVTAAEEAPEKSEIVKQETYGEDTASEVRTSESAVKEEAFKTASEADKSGSSSKKSPSSPGKTQNDSTNSQKTDSSKGKETSAALKKVSVQLGSAAGELKNTGEKQMLYKIQTVLKRVSENPDYNYKQDAKEVMTWYRGLQTDEKSRVKNAIMHNVEVSNILKLLSIFGF